MNYFIDTEFIESGPGEPIRLIGIGIVDENGRSFYRQNSECDLDKANDWVKANVLPHLDRTFPDTWGTLAEIATAVLAFVGNDPEPCFWGYYADYDWVVFCQMFGTMIDLPNGWPMYCRDIKQWCDQLGNPMLPEQDSAEHHALSDAIWNRTAYQFLANLAGATS